MGKKKVDDALDGCRGGEAEALRIARMLNDLPFRSDRWEPFSRGDNGMPATSRITGVSVLLSTQQPIGWRSLNDKLAAAVEKDLDHADAAAAETKRARDFVARMDGTAQRTRSVAPAARPARPAPRARAQETKADRQRRLDAVTAALPDPPEHARHLAAEMERQRRSH